MAGEKPKGTADDIVAKYYGINASTYKVECAEWRGDGVLTRPGRSKPKQFRVPAGTSAAVICNIVFGLRDIQCVAVDQFDSRWEAGIVSRLEAMAAEYARSRSPTRRATA